MENKKKIAVVGGGSGTYQVLMGLKKHPVELSAVISMCDSGGSTGRLRKELDILPPGDVRRALLALSDLPFAQKTLEEIFSFRFEKGGSLKDHSVGNILLAALVQITGSMEKAIEEASRILHSNGNVYPVTLDNTNLVAILKDKTKVFGETNIDMRIKKPNIAIEKVYLKPKASIYKKAYEAIKNADLIVLGPGDLYTSLIPTLLVDGMCEAITNSKGKVLFVVNLVTKRGETNNFTGKDFVEEVKKYLNCASKKLKYVLISKEVNNENSKVTRWYKRYGSKPVKNDLVSNNEYQIICRNFVSSTTFFRHDSDKLAKAILSVL